MEREMPGLLSAIGTELQGMIQAMGMQTPGGGGVSSEPAGPVEDPQQQQQQPGGGHENVPDLT